MGRNSENYDRFIFLTMHKMSPKTYFHNTSLFILILFLGQIKDENCSFMYESKTWVIMNAIT